MEGGKPLVLLVDDFEDTRDLYAHFLSMKGFGVASATSGPDAVEKAAGLKPSVIVMDLSLPGMDGWETTKRLKADERTTHIPVLMLTAYGMDGPAAEGVALKAGFHGVLVKPCLPDRMITEIIRVL